MHSIDDTAIMSSRDEILANFQVSYNFLQNVIKLLYNLIYKAFTGLEDIGTCINILEQHSWDLLVSTIDDVMMMSFCNVECRQ